ncbi:MAG: diacylglycerol/lipid kinase family protein [Christensenellales bacterium]
MICFIVNSIAGKGKALRIIERIARRLSRDKVPHDIRYTAFPGHATTLTREAITDGYTTIVAVGGDGSVGEVATGLRDTGAALGVIPGGSGNDYCRALGIPADPMRALDVVLAGRRRMADALSVNDRLFMNIANIGFGNAVAIQAERFKKLGRLAYLVAVFFTVSRFRGVPVRFTLDGQPFEQPILLMDIGCGTHLGGGMKALPCADPFDGMLDVCFVDNVSPSTIIRLLPLYISGKHEKLPIAHFHRCRSVTLEYPEGPVTVGADGERVAEADRTQVTILPAAIPVIVP